MNKDQQAHSTRLWSDVPLHPDALSLLNGRVEWLESDGAKRFDPSGIEGADIAVVGSFFRADGETLDRAPRLKALCRLGIGVDNVDIDAATERGICVLNTPDASTVAVAEVAIGLMIGLLHRLFIADRMLSDGVWDAGPSLVGDDLAGMVVGLVGLGRIGRAVAQRLRVFGCHIVGIDPGVTDMEARDLGIEPCAELHTLLNRSDVVSLHLPATSETSGLIGEAQLDAMRPGSYLVNVSRGALVVEADLLAALDRGHLGGAALDVWDPEPPDPSNPLLSHPRLIATPHIAAATSQARARSESAAVSQLLDVLEARRPPNLLNPEVWEHRRMAR